MSVLVLLIAVGSVSVLLLAVLAVALIRQLKTLRNALAAFQGEVRPLLEEINRDGARAQGRLQDLADRGSALSEQARGRRAGPED